MPKVLIVAGRDLAPELGTTSLWSTNVERVFADSLGAALEVARGFTPSLVVVDVVSVDDSASLISRLRESPGTRRSSMVAMCRAEAAPTDDLRDAGANLVLTPPVDPERWNTTFEGLLAVPRRLRMRFPVHLRPSGEGAREPLEAQCLDVSPNGMLLKTPHGLPLGETIDLSFTLPEDEAALSVGAVVVRISPASPFLVGVRLAVTEDEYVSERIRAWATSIAPERDFGRYEALGLLGEGAMGRVYRAFDPLAGRVIAIKTVRPEHLVGPEKDEYLRRFRREAQAAARLDHPNIVTVFDVGEDYFAMELIEGATLQAVLRERGRFTPEEAGHILRPVADAIDYANARGTIHRDIKPANIMILTAGRPKVMDFGVAHLVSGPITGSGETFGSPSYMAPEQVAHGEATALTDQFSLGIVAYEMLTGCKPFEGDGVGSILYRLVNSEATPPSARTGKLPSRIDSIFGRVLSKDPSKRFPTALAFVDALDGQRPSTAPIVVVPVPAGGTPPTSLHALETVDLRKGTQRFRTGLRRNRVASGTLAAVLLVGLVGSWRFGALNPTVRPSPPGLSITSEPSGATVGVDGRSVGSTPLSLLAVRPGLHSITLGREGFAPTELKVEVPASGSPVPVQVVLQAVGATLRIESEPTPALVTVDGASVGATPLLSVQLTPGTHEARVERQGFEAWTGTISASAGEAVSRVVRLRAVGRPGAQEDGRLRGWIRRGDMVEMGPGVTPPLKVSGNPPSYSAAARALHLGGRVTLELTVGEDGRVVEARVVESASEVLDQAFLDAARTWRYQPAEASGVQVRVRVQESYTFDAAH